MQKLIKKISSIIEIILKVIKKFIEKIDQQFLESKKTLFHVL